MPSVSVEPLDYAEAADLFRAVSNNALNHYNSANSALRKFGKMAGDDNGGQAFADAYDAGAQVMLQSLYDIAVAASSFDRALMATGKMHHQAEQFAAGLPANDGAYVIRDLVPEVCVVAPPGAYGGPADPGIIDVMRDLFALIWPNADTPLMKQAGKAWIGISEDFSALAREIRQAKAPIGSVVSAEVGYIDTKIDELAQGIDELAESALAISDVCVGYAEDVDDAHNEVIPMAVQLAAEIAIGVGISAALSFVTFGAAAVVGTGALAVRIAFVAARITAIVVRVGGTALRVATRISQVVANLQRVANRFRRLFQVGVEIVASISSSVVVEGLFNGQDPNFGAAAFGGLIGGGVAGGITAALAARTAGLMGRIAVGTFAGSASGGIGAAADSIVRIGEFDPRAIMLGATVGGVGGGAFGVKKPAAGGGGSPTAATPDGVGAPKIEGPNLPKDLSLDGPVTAPDVDIPTNPGGDSTPGGESARPPVDVDPFTPQVDVDPVTPRTPVDVDPTTPRPPVDVDPFTPELDVDPMSPVGDNTVQAGDDGTPYSASDSLAMTGTEGARIDLGDSHHPGHRLLDDPSVIGEQSRSTGVEPAPADVLARDDVQALLTGHPPVLTLENGVLRLNDVQHVQFNLTNPKHDMPEFLRQGALQEDGSNEFSVGQLLDGRDDFLTNGRQGANEQAAFRSQIDGTFDSPFAKWDVLHGPDQIMAGNHTNFDGAGDSGVNRSIGAQWKREAPRLERSLDDLTADLSPDLLHWIYPNIEIRIVNMLASGRIPT